MNENSELPQFKIIGNEDGTATLGLGTQSVTISLEDLEALIAGLADLRARHPIQVPIDPPWQTPGALHPRLEVVPDPRFYVQGTAMQDSTVVSFRHPGYGWLSYQIPMEHSETLSRLIQQQMSAPQASGQA